MKSILSRLIAALALLALAAAGCAPPEPVSSQGRLTVVTTIGMIRDVVENVGGPHVRVTGLMGPGVDPHLYKASEGDVRRLFRADVVFYGGLHLEARMGEVLEEMGARTRVVAVTDGIPRGRLLSPAEFQGAYDPHVWFDVSMWAMTIDTIASTLAAADPAHAADFRRNAAAYHARLDSLHAYVRAQAERVPRERRVLVTAHDAFNYFGRAYGFQVRGLQGISTETEAGIREISQAVEFIVKNKIPAVFVETSVSPKTIERVIADCRGRGWDVKLGGELFSDAMGSPGQHPPYAVETYEGMVRYNVDTVVNALK